MSNYCQNYIVITGSSDSIALLTGHINNPVKVVDEHMWLSKLSFDQPPWEFGLEFESDYKPGTYVMSRTVGSVIDKTNLNASKMEQLLGTKWDFCFDTFSATDTQINATFVTPWKPATNWFKLVSTKYGVQGELSFGEGGNDFGGILCIKDNKVSNYKSPYKEWECLNYDSHSNYVEKLLDDEDDYPEYIERIIRESKTWPKSWAEYKDRYFVDSQCLHAK